MTGQPAVRGKKLRLRRILNDLATAFSLVLIGYSAIMIVWILFIQIPLSMGRFDSSLNGLSPKPEDRMLRLTELQRINPDIVGWILVDGTKISYPVLHDGGIRPDAPNQSEAIYHYLYYDYKERRSAVGCIMADYRNMPDLSDPYTIIYGHNLGQKGVMFSDLKKFEEEAFFFDNPTAHLFSARGREDLMLLLVAHVSGYSEEVYGTEDLDQEMENPFDAAAGLRFLQEHALYAGTDTLPTEDRYVLLSTCYDHEDPDNPLRLVLLYRVVERSSPGSK